MFLAYCYNPTMVTGVEFDEDKFSYAPRGQSRPGAAPAPASYNNLQYASSRPSGIAGWLISHGWAKSEKSAQGIMLGIMTVNFIIMYVVIKYFL